MPAERVKLVGLKARVGRVNDDMRLADLVLKLPTQKVIVMGTPAGQRALREPSSPVEIFDDLSDRPIQITKYTAWEWARCSRRTRRLQRGLGQALEVRFVDTFNKDGPPDPLEVGLSNGLQRVGPRPAPPGAAALHGQGERSCEGRCTIHRRDGRTDAGPAL